MDLWPDASEPFRYLELVHREGTGRYDMPLPWCIDGQAGDVSLPAAEAAAFGALHDAMDGVARPITSELWPVSAEMRAGCVISEPGALAQPSHRDGPDGLVTVFAPLTAFVPRNGPTELSPATHRGGDDSSSLAPLLQPVTSSFRLPASTAASRTRVPPTRGAYACTRGGRSRRPNPVLRRSNSTDFCFCCQRVSKDVHGVAFKKLLVSYRR